MQRPVEATIDKVSLKPNKIQPIIVHFQNGKLKDEEVTNMKCGLYREEKSNKQLLALSNGQIVYRGHRPDPDEAPTYTMLAIHNKRTGKVRLVQAERWQVAAVLDKEVESNIDLDENRIAMLHKQFGSKKVKRRTEQIERMKIDVETVKEQLEKTVSSVNIERSELSLPSLQDDSVTNMNMPNCNRSASRVEDVYDINDIVPLEKLETLHEGCNFILHEKVEGKSKFFEKTLSKLKSKVCDLNEIAILLYMEAVVTWLSMPIKDAKKKGSDICPLSTDISNHVIQSYSVPSAHGRQRPNTMRDKGMIHCIILGLMISNYKLDLNLLTTIFKNRVGIKKLGELARFVGAVSSKDDKNSVILKLPLPPQLVVARKGKKKG
ncbi:uncharacterized protein LOC105685590 [Athalia rosae]|uniref:uncharacterized protein LOC105685590 n=1 Tax=Athalia rosae TaxID=37344 RepID=UPI00203485F1|nr:uncharacterized protein LOC105685590 [Athalia rosae]